MGKQTICVMVIIETDDGRFADISASTAARAAALRKAVIDNLPQLTRVVAVMPEQEARIMMMTHDLAKQAAGLGPVLRPPPDYVPPTME